MGGKARTQSFSTSPKNPVPHPSRSDGWESTNPFILNQPQKPRAPSIAKRWVGKHEPSRSQPAPKNSVPHPSQSDGWESTNPFILNQPQKTPCPIHREAMGGKARNQSFSASLKNPVPHPSRSDGWESTNPKSPALPDHEVLGRGAQRLHVVLVARLSVGANHRLRARQPVAHP